MVRRGHGLGFVLRRDPDQVRVPDVSFIANADVPESGLLEGFWEDPPTLAAEVVAPSDLAEDFHERVRDYLEAGARQVRVLWSRTRSASIYSPDGTARAIGPDATLDGGDILSGFNVTVGDLFEVQGRR